MLPLPGWKTLLANALPTAVGALAYMTEVVGPEAALLAAVGGTVVTSIAPTVWKCPLLSGKKITGVVSGLNNEVAAGLEIGYSGTASGTITTGVGGAYTSPWLPNGGTYKLSLAVKFHDVVPAEITVADLVANRDGVNFNIRRRTVSVTGKVVPSGNENADKIKVVYSGASAGEVRTGPDGSYTIAGLLEGGNYTIAPEIPKWHDVQPANRAIVSLASGQGDVNFDLTRRKVTLKGQLAADDGNVPAGLTIRYSGNSSGTAATLDGGAFSIPNLPEGRTFTITPDAVPHYTLDRVDLRIDNLTADQTAEFKLTRNKVSITGRIAPAGAEKVEGLEVDYTGASKGSAKTLPDGRFTLKDLSEGGQYTIVPRKPDFHTLDRADVKLPAVAAGDAANFTLTRQTFVISGIVAAPKGHSPQDVTIQWDGEVTGSATANQQGEFRTAPLPAGVEYTITPDKLHYELDPLQIRVTLDGDKNDRNFKLRLATYTISGCFAEYDLYSGKEVGKCAEVAVKLSGDAARAAVTGKSGMFRFEVPALGNYALSFQKNDVEFEPASPIQFQPLTVNWDKEIESRDLSYQVKTRQRPPRVPKWYDALPKDNDGWPYWDHANSIASGRGAHSADHLPGLIAAVGQGNFTRTDVLPRIVAHAIRNGVRFNNTGISWHYRIDTLPGLNGTTIPLRGTIVVVWNFVANPTIASCGTVFDRV